MKKLNLKLEGIGEMLNKEQMKKIVGGGYDDCPPPGPCSPWERPCEVFDYTCFGNTRYYCSSMPYC